MKTAPLSKDSFRSARRVLDPTERASEILFGLIMVLTITSSLSVAEAGRSEVRTMLFGALGCNLAWGIIDGVFYLMSSLSERGFAIKALRALRSAPDALEARRIIAETLPPVVASVMSPEEFEVMREKLNRLPDPPVRPQITKHDLLGAIAVFLLVFLSTFPVATPFIFVSNSRLALRISSGIAIAMLFLTGHELGRYAGSHPWRTGLAMVILGGVLVGITKALGG